MNKARQAGRTRTTFGSFIREMGRRMADVKVNTVENQRVAVQIVSDTMDCHSSAMLIFYDGDLCELTISENNKPIIVAQKYHIDSLLSLFWEILYQAGFTPANGVVMKGGASGG